MSPGCEARRFLRQHRHGVLSTLSKKLDGFDVRADDALLRFDFAEPAAHDVRAALVAMARQARA